MLKAKKYGDYKLIKQLGQGAFGNVFLAQKGNTEYAIKCIDKDKIITEGLAENVKTELLLMKMIRHPYIVKLHEILSSAQKIIFVMECVQGGDLFDKIKESPDERLTEDESRLYFQQIIMALEYCHSLKIIHRDLKPENILIDKVTKSIKISDFGLATLLKEKDEKLSDACGTTYYLAPEVIKETGEIWPTGGYSGQAADVWSAGVILYNMVSGENPFHSEDQTSTINNILNATANYPDYFSTGLIDLLKKIFVPQPKYRYTIEQIKEHPWFATNFKPVIGYLKDNPNEIENVDDPDVKEASPMKERSSFSLKDLIVDYDKVPIINCFELSTMLAGKWISKMFVPPKTSTGGITQKTSTSSQFHTEYERYSYEFTCDLYYEEMLSLVDSFFKKNSKGILYINQGAGKFIIEMVFSSIENLNIYFQLFKIHEKKNIFSLSFKDGNKVTYLRIMQDFCEENIGSFKLF